MTVFLDLLIAWSDKKHRSSLLSYIVTAVQFAQKLILAYMFTRLHKGLDIYLLAILFFQRKEWSSALGCPGWTICASKSVMGHQKSVKLDLNKEAEITELIMGQEMQKSTVPSALKTFAFYNVAVSVQPLEVNEPFPGAVVNLLTYKSSLWHWKSCFAPR